MNLCHHSCLECTGLTENECLTCPSESFRIFKKVDNESGTCKCIDSYYESAEKKCVGINIIY